MDMAMDSYKEGVYAFCTSGSDTIKFDLRILKESAELTCNPMIYLGRPCFFSLEKRIQLLPQYHSSLSMKQQGTCSNRGRKLNRVSTEVT
ncbi:hypothetical protein Y1Q_0021889 [Alligator mississippiensis]|uniref:Uncharacterized protein n=1 Tax=Alligator mississippiensis TaxID=8496 RepID=A0A151M612_ALLMI|nr:hypothetical protein Y1Q_0021889 [Alligator mississippiensis]